MQSDLAQIAEHMKKTSPLERVIGELRESFANWDDLAEDFRKRDETMQELLRPAVEATTESFKAFLPLARAFEGQQPK